MRRAACALLLVASLVFAACTAAPQPGTTALAGGAVTFVLEDDVTDLDPLTSRNVTDRNVQYQIYDSLVRMDPSGRVIPWLAESWSVSDGDTVVTFLLRGDVRFHDGTRFDADSAKWNLDRYRTGKGSARLGELTSIEAVEAVDPRTLRIKMKAPFAALLPTLIDRAGMMLSRTAVEAGGPDFARKPFKAGSGPFVLAEVVKDDHVTVVRNEDWWGRDTHGTRLPYLEKVVFRPIPSSDVRFTQLRSGDAQIANRLAGKDVAQARTEAGLVYQEVPSYAFGSLTPNRAPGFLFNEGRYVKAVAMAIDRQAILEKGFAGFGSVGHGAIAPTHFAYDPAFRPYGAADAAGARALVQQVGRGPLRFELLVIAGDPAGLQVAQLIQSQLAQADIVAEIKTLELAQILKQQADRKFTGLTLLGWSGRLDPDGNTYDLLHSRGVANDSSYSNPQVDRLLEEQRATTDQAKRRAALRAAERIYAVEDPARIWYRFGAAQLLTVRSLRGLEPYVDGLVRLQYAWLGK